MDKTFQILLKLLKSFNYNLPEQEVKERLFSDPDKGVTSITNTLDYFNIKNLVANVPKGAFNQLPNSFIAQVGNHKQSSLVLINKIDEKNVKISTDKEQLISMSIDDFLMNWTGLIIAIEKNENRNPKNLKKLLLNTVPLLVALLLILIIVFTTNYILKSVYFVLSLVGVYVSFLIIKEKLSSDNSSSKFCKISENTDCQSVLKSKESKLFNIIDLSDASIVYFSSLSIVFLFNPTILVFKSLSILSLPIVFYSIYHQYFKIKKWCPLCLVIASILLLQFFVLKMILHESKFNFLLVFPILLIFIISIISWINLKKLLVNNFENKRLRIENLTFRRDYNLFLPHYFALKPINVDYSSLDIKMGNNNSSVKITAITNPLCETCFEVHNIYMKLLKRYPNKLEINFHFFVPFDNRKDPRTQISERLLQFYAEDRNRFFEAFDEWYSKVSIKKWLKKWGKCDDLKYNEILKEHHFWCVSKEVDSTPTILINGKVFSKNYNPLDMENFIGHIIRLEKK